MPKITNHLTAVILALLSACLIIVAADQTRPYEFSFNIADFQHRYEKKDSMGIVTGEYGFITADGVYHETGYATDKNGDFKITKMRNRKITSLQVAQEIFKGKPEVAKRVIQVLAKSCSGCGIPVHKHMENKSNEPDQNKGIEKGDEKTQFSHSSLNGKTTPAANTERERKRGLAMPESLNNTTDTRDSNSPRVANGIIDNTPNDLHYRFNYTITSHDHEETGYRDGKKNGSYRTLGINGTDARVEYSSNEFGHHPNITFVNRQDASDAKETIRGFTFEWIYDRR